MKKFTIETYQQPPYIPIFLSQYSCSYYEEPHTHEFLEIAYVVSGKGKHYVDDTSYEITSGDIFVINNTESHEFGPDDSNEPLEIINCCFCQSFLQDEPMDNLQGLKDFFCLEPFFRREYGFSHRLNIVGEKNVYIYGLLKNMLSEYRNRPPGYLLMLKSHLLNLLVTIARFYEQITLNNSQFRTNRVIIDKTLQYINAHLDHEISVHQLAEMVNLSSSHFSRIFKNSTGKTLTQFINECRLEQARQYLLNTDKSVTEICYDAGFSNPSYFGKLFKDTFGSTPTKYRQMKQEAKQALDPA